MPPLSSSAQPTPLLSYVWTQPSRQEMPLALSSFLLLTSLAVNASLLLAFPSLNVSLRAFFEILQSSCGLTRPFATI